MPRLHLSAFLLACLPLQLLAQDVTAVLEPAQSVELRSTVNGRVTEVLSLEGTLVSGGQIVARIDAAVQAARVSLAQVSANAKGAAKRAETLVEQAKFRRDRLASALAKGAAQAWEVEMAEQAVAVAQADLSVVQDEQDRRAAELALEQATLSEFAIRAPFDATILNVAVDPGEIVDTATVLVEVGALDTLQATAFVPIDWLTAITVSEPIGATFEDGAKQEISVLAVDPRIDPASRTVRLIVEVANADGTNRPGQIVTLHDPR